MTAELAVASPQARWATLSRTERTAAYDNNAAVANSPALIEARNAASATYRGAQTRLIDIAYGAAARTRLDIYPAAEATAPCLVFIHGGYWQRGARELFAAYAAGPAAIGWSVAMPSYTLAPDAPLAAIVAEIGQCLDWLVTRGAEHGIAGPVILSGWSAGAQLAALHLAHPRVTAGLAISGVFDLGPIRDTALNEALRLTDDEIAILSPLRLPVIPKPLAIAYGSRELPALVDDARRFHAIRSAADAPGPLIPVAGADHFTVLDELARGDGLLVDACRSLLGLA